MNDALGAVLPVSFDVADWLDHLPTRDDQTCRVEQLLPDGYPVYLRLFHPLFPWNTNHWAPGDAPRTTWRELAAKAGVVYGPTLTWRQLEPVLPIEGGVRLLSVQEGRIDPVTASYLFETLSARTGKSPVYYAYGLAGILWIGQQCAFWSEGLVPPSVLWRAVERITGEDLIGPEWIWPENRSWIVHTDYDLESTYIAAGQELADALLAYPELEVVQVSLDTRVDWRADEQT